jgi:hypothetical protein
VPGCGWAPPAAHVRPACVSGPAARVRSGPPAAQVRPAARVRPGGVSGPPRVSDRVPRSDRVRPGACSGRPATQRKHDPSAISPVLSSCDRPKQAGPLGSSILPCGDQFEEERPPGSSVGSPHDREQPSVPMRRLLLTARPGQILRDSGPRRAPASPRGYQAGTALEVPGRPHARRLDCGSCRPRPGSHAADRCRGA